MRFARSSVVISACVGLLFSLAAVAQEVLEPPTVFQTPFSLTIVEQPLITTHWTQGDPLHMYDPKCGSACTDRDHQRLGCWSIAIAQIMYYLRLQPHGSQQYGIIDEDLTHRFDVKDSSGKDGWTKMAAYSPAMTEDDPIAKETALFCYYAAVVLKKTFLATCDPCDKDNDGYSGTSYAQRANQIETHYSCTTYYKVARPTDSAVDRAGVERTIRNELEARRPLLLYMDGYQWKKRSSGLYKASTGHAVVIDGYSDRTGEFMVHLNFGWKDRSGDGWYVLWHDITVGQPGHEKTVVLGRDKSGSATNRRVLVILPNIPVI